MSLLGGMTDSYGMAGLAGQPQVRLSAEGIVRRAA